MPTYLLSPTVICRRRRASSALLFGSALLLLGGCMAEKKRPVIAWRTASIVRPIVPTPQAADAITLPEVDSVPSLVLPAPNVTFLPPRTSPPRPHVASQSATAGNAKDEGPLIVPQISAAEFANAQQETNASLSIAEKNLKVVQGKTLNAAQTDMSNKVKSFMSDAREAARNGDWARARSLARKAQAISEELARSL